MGAFDISMYRGDDRTFVMTATAGGVALNLTGGTLRFTAKREVTDLDAQAVIGPLACTLVTPALGIFSVTIPSAETLPLTEETKLLWDVEITLGGVKRTVPEDATGRPRPGTLRIRMDVSSA